MTSNKPTRSSRDDAAGTAFGHLLNPYNLGQRVNTHAAPSGPLTPLDRANCAIRAKAYPLTYGDTGAMFRPTRVDYMDRPAARKSALPNEVLTGWPIEEVQSGLWRITFPSTEDARRFGEAVIRNADRQDAENGGQS